MNGDEGVAHEATGPAPSDSRDTPYRMVRLKTAVLVGCGIFCVWAAIGLVRAVGDAREAARRMQCHCHLGQLSLALYAYTDQYGTLPPAYVADAEGRPMHSWRVLLLPFMSHEDIYRQYDFNEPWNGPHNMALAESNPFNYHCPSDVSNERTASYVAIVGPRTAWGGGGAGNEGAKGAAARLLAIVEVRDSGIHWMEPRDLPVERLPEIVGYDCPRNHPGHIYAVTTKGNVVVLSASTSESALLEMAQRPADGPEE